jgi:hypothetical protein
MEQEKGSLESSGTSKAFTIVNGEHVMRMYVSVAYARNE